MYKKKESKGTQGDKFIKAAHALGCDESPEAFAKKIKAIASVKSASNEQVKKKAKQKTPRDS